MFSAAKSLGFVRTLPIALGLFSLACALSWLDLHAPLRRDAEDWMVRQSSRSPPEVAGSSADVAVVALDPRSLRALPDWPWPRDRYGALVEALEAYGVTAVGFDIDFSTPRDSRAEALFAEAMGASGRVALAGFRQIQELPGGIELEVANLPVQSLATAAGGIGSVLVPVESDGVVRRFPLQTAVGGRPLPPLAEATLALSDGRSPETSAGAAYARIDYRRANPPIPTISAVDVLEGTADGSLLTGRAVLVGATAAEFQDLWTTPVGAAMPGVWIQAVAMRTISARRAGLPTLAGAPAAQQWSLWLLLSLGAGSLGGLRHRRRVALLAAVATAVPLSCLMVLGRTGQIWDPVLPLCLIGAHYVFGLESVRRRIGLRLEADERSLGALAGVGRATVNADAGNGIDLALSLLGDVVAARGVAFLRATPHGDLDGTRLEWAPETPEPIGDLDTARGVLHEGRTQTFSDHIPGSEAPGAAAYFACSAGSDRVGVLVVERTGRAAFDPTELRTIATAAAQLALSAHNLRLLDDLRSTFASSISAIASAIEARDGYTESHCQRLAAFSVAVGYRLGMSEEELEGMRLGALLHDVGKIGIRDEILLKPGRFTDEERLIMESHTEVGHRIVAPIHGISALSLSCVRHHHERWDGTGYPKGLAGEEIPRVARVVSVVDVWDALSTKRPYKDALPQETVLEILDKGRGTQFDPEILDVFFAVLEEEGEEMLALIDRSVEGLV